MVPSLSYTRALAFYNKAWYLSISIATVEKEPGCPRCSLMYAKSNSCNVLDNKQDWFWPQVYFKAGTFFCKHPPHGAGNRNGFISFAGNGITPKEHSTLCITEFESILIVWQIWQQRSQTDFCNSNGTKIWTTLRPGGWNSCVFLFKCLTKKGWLWASSTKCTI